MQYDEVIIGADVITLRQMYDIPASTKAVVIRIYKSGFVKLLYGRNLTGQKIKGIMPLNNIVNEK